MQDPRVQSKATSLPTLCCSQRGSGERANRGFLMWMGTSENQSSPQYRGCTRWQIEKEMKRRKSKFPHGPLETDRSLSHLGPVIPTLVQGTSPQPGSPHATQELSVTLLTHRHARKTSPPSQPYSLPLSPHVSSLAQPSAHSCMFHVDFVHSSSICVSKTHSIFKNQHRAISLPPWSPP